MKTFNMAPSVIQGAVRRQEISCRKELMEGKIDSDEYFGTVLSILGNETTFKAFPAILKEIAVETNQFHNSLSLLYETYFHQFCPTTESTTPSIQAPLCALDEELDFELAIQLSLKENGTGGSDIWEPEGASNVAYGYTPGLEKDVCSEGGTAEDTCNMEDFPQVTPISNGGSMGQGRTTNVTNTAATNNVARTSRRRGNVLQGAWGDTDTRTKSNTSAWASKTSGAVMGRTYHDNSFFSTPKYTFVSASASTVKGDPKESTNVNSVKQHTLHFPSAEPNVKPARRKASVLQTNTSHQLNHTLASPVAKNQVAKNKRQSKTGSIQRPLHNRPVVYWLRRDLRIYDNPALMEAATGDAPVIPVFLWSEVEEGPLAAGGATKLWLHHCLQSLNKNFQESFLSQILFIKTNSCLRELQRLVKESGAGSIVWNDVYEPYLKRRDDIIVSHFKKSGVRVKRHHSYLLYEPGCVNMESVGLRGLGSVTHFMEACRQSVIEPIAQPLEAPHALPRPGQWPDSHTINQLELAKMPRRKDGSIIDWAAPMVAAWDFSENAAYEALQEFLGGAVRKYEKESGRSDQLNTCRISPYLHFGQISPATVLHEAKHKKCNKFLRKLAWRDLSYFLLDMFPHMDKEPLRPPYKHQRWSGNKRHLKAWQQGQTGYPLVDAAMRQLWLTGWMNNYMRHVVASFLISYLHLHWVEGYNWFQDTLFDADVAINAMMWQNGGMSGMDHWNFVMHPVDAAMTCDPNSDYIRKWVPELAALPDEFVCKPWKCPPSILRRAGIALGSNYPERIITDLEEAREQSLRDAVDVRTHHSGKFVDRRTGNDLVPLPCGILLPVITRKEFKYKTSNPDAEDNPYSAVLHGYRSRKRDEAIDFANKVDFLSSTMNECVKRSERTAKANQYEIY